MSGNVHTMGELASVFLYLIIYTISAYFMSKSKILEDKRLDMSFVVAVLLPVLLAANRYYVGTDFENYYLMYKGMSRTSFLAWITKEMSIDGIPFGIWFVSRIAFQFRSYKMFYGLIAAIAYVPAAIGFKKLLPKESHFLIIFAFLTGTFTSGLNIMKQAAAISISIFALQYVQERKFWKFLLTCFLAFCFHPSAAVFIVVYFFWNPEDVNFSFKRILLLVASVVFLVCIPQILPAIGGRFESYTEYSGEISNRTFYLSLAWLFIFYLFRNKFKAITWFNDLALIMVLISQILNLSGFFFGPYVNRISLYFGVSATCLRAQFPLLFCEPDRKFLQFLIYVYAVVVFIYSVYTLGGSEVIPYQFYGGM